MTTEISLKQVPVIQYKEELTKIGKSIDERIKELNLDGQIATADTIKALKTLRADFNKELKEYETQRTAIKKEILKEYDNFEADYKLKIKEKIEKAVETLKDKIAFVEDDLLAKKTTLIKEYFNELCSNKKIEFLTFDQIDVNITLSVADKQYKEKCIEFVNKVADDLELIDTQANKTEILVEYKTSLNVARSIKTVQDRKAAIELQEKQDKQEQLNKRIQIIESLGFTFNESTANYEKESDWVSYETLQNSKPEVFKQWAEDKINELTSIPEPSFPQNVVENEGDVIFMDTPKFSAPKISTREYTFKGTDKQFEKLEEFALLNNITISKITH